MQVFVKLHQAVVTSIQSGLRWLQRVLVMNKQHNQFALHPVASVLMVTGVVALSLGLPSLKGAIAAETLSFPAVEIKGEQGQKTMSRPGVVANSTAKLPPAIASTLRQDLSQRTGVPAKKFQVVKAVPRNWPDGCLGLPATGEMCTQAIVKGWQVTLSNRTRRWVYRTDAQGKVYRLEPGSPQSRSVPSPPRSPAVSKPVSELQLSEIPVAELPPGLESGVMFRAIASGGFIGRTSQTVLMQDGRLIRSWLNAAGLPTQAETRYLAPAQVQEFQQILQRHSLQSFHRQNYPAVPGSADFFTMTLSSQSGTVRYADTIQDRLPSRLQALIQSWNALTRVG